jgi:hypothetical protein
LTKKKSKNGKQNKSQNQTAPSTYENIYTKKKKIVKTHAHIVRGFSVGTGCQQQARAVRLTFRNSTRQRRLTHL